MRQALHGGFITAICLMLAGCFAPMTTREAQAIAQTKVARFCKGKCGRITPGQTQKIKDRWLVDLDDPRHKFTVTVENDGNSKLDVWNK